MKRIICSKVLFWSRGRAWIWGQLLLIETISSVLGWNCLIFIPYQLFNVGHYTKASGIFSKGEQSWEAHGNKRLSVSNHSTTWGDELSGWCSFMSTTKCGDDVPQKFGWCSFMFALKWGWWCSLKFWMAQLQVYPKVEHEWTCCLFILNWFKYSRPSLEPNQDIRLVIRKLLFLVIFNTVGPPLTGTCWHRVWDYYKLASK